MSRYAIAFIQLPIEIKEDMTVVHLTDHMEIHCVPCSIEQIPSKKPEFYISNKMNQFVKQMIESKKKEKVVVLETEEVVDDLTNDTLSDDQEEQLEETPEENPEETETFEEDNPVIYNPVIYNPIIETKIDTIPSQVVSKKDRSITTFKNYKTKHVKNRTIRNLLIKP